VGFGNRGLRGFKKFFQNPIKVNFFVGGGGVI